MNERVEVVRAQREIVLEQSTVCGILVMLEVGGRQVFLVRLGADGSIHRLGNGSVDHLERDRFIGTASPELFERMSGKITPQLLEWCGQSRSHPSPRGEVCELVIAFKQEDGRELMMAWQFGSLSKWPPTEVLEFVDSLVEATDPWYEEQKCQLRRRAQKSEYEWWRYFSLTEA